MILTVTPELVQDGSQKYTYSPLPGRPFPIPPNDKTVGTVQYGMVSRQKQKYVITGSF